MSKLFRVILAAAVAAGVSACTTAHAGAPTTAPPLEVPPPPPHVVAPAPELPSVPEPVGELPPPATEPPPHVSRPAPPKTAPAEVKPETKPGDAKPPETTSPAEQPKEAPKPPELAPQLVTPQSPDTNVAVRATIDRARGLLQSVDYQQLSKERKRAYTDAKNFLQQAEKALQQNNLQLAHADADKAEKLAYELSGR